MWLNGSKQPHQWTKAELTKLKALRAEGKGAAAIGTALGLSMGTVKCQLRKIEEPARLAKKKKAEASAPDGRIRPCMCCHQPFRSAGFHNRLCSTCRKLDGGTYSNYDF